jgi:gamma-glutamylaminecyclotransferase
VTYKLFVYGTLRRGFHNHDLMRNAKHICDGRTTDSMRLMVHRGHGIPFTWKDEGGKPLRGEFYEIDEEDIMPIHSMEVSAGYEAKWLSIILDSGETARALVYLYPPTENQFFMDIPQCDYSMFRVRI